MSRFKPADFVIPTSVVLLIGGMAFILFSVLGVSETVGAGILFLWMLAIGYFGGKIATNYGS